MANNRVWLKNKATGERILLAKYYPSTNWFSQNFPELQKVLNGTHDKTLFGGQPFELEYEIEED